MRSGARPGSYEVSFLTFTDPATGRGFWIRSTLLAPKRGEAWGGIWFARFDPADPAATFGIHATSSIWSASPDAFQVEIGKHAGAQHSVMRPGHAYGAVRAGDRK